jgi:hypothetical protein
VTGRSKVVAAHRANRITMTPIIVSFHIATVLVE